MCKKGSLSLSCLSNHMLMFLFTENLQTLFLHNSHALFDIFFYLPFELPETSARSSLLGNDLPEISGMVFHDFTGTLKPRERKRLIYPKITTKAHRTSSFSCFTFQVMLIVRTQYSLESPFHMLDLRCCIPNP